MRDISRIDVVCGRLAEIWKKFPDWRLMQLIDNFQCSMRSDCFYMEDGDFIERLNSFAEVLSEDSNK